MTGDFSSDFSSDFKIISDDMDSMSVHDQEHKLRMLRYNSDTLLRKMLAKWTLWVISIWMGIVLLIVIFTGIQLMVIPSEIMITLLTTTFANVVGLVIIVLKGFFERMNQNVFGANEDIKMVTKDNML